MKNTSRAQSTTSLPQAPRDDADSRFAKYAIMMSVRLACLIAMVLITPYDWYTWVLAAGAIVLPYLAVVIANVGQDARRVGPENPERMLEAPASAPRVEDPRPSVIRIAETPRLDPPSDPRP